LSEANVETVRAIYAEWEQGNFRAGVDRYDPLALLVQGPGFPEAGAYLGLEGFAEYMQTFLEAWERVTIEAEDLFGSGDSVVAAVIQRAIGKGSEAPVEFRYFQVWSFRGGKVIRLETVRDRAVAFEAAGLSSAPGGA
jgi:ketosteroid isomerase-like protein